MFLETFKVVLYYLYHLLINNKSPITIRIGHFFQKSSLINSFIHYVIPCKDIFKTLSLPNRKS